LGTTPNEKIEGIKPELCLYYYSTHAFNKYFITIHQTIATMTLHPGGRFEKMHLLEKLASVEKKNRQ